MKRVLFVLAGAALLLALAGCLSMDSSSPAMPTPEVVMAAGPENLSAAGNVETAEPADIPPALQDKYLRGSGAIEVAATGGFAWADPVEVPALDLSGGTTEVYCEGAGANIRLTLPDGWDYELVREIHGAGESWDAYEDFGIRFWPADRAGSMTLWYYPHGFGVCGTGLTSQRVTFASGLTAERGRWDGNWEYISFRDTPGSGCYVAQNSGLDSNTLNTAMEILGTAALGEGFTE